MAEINYLTIEEAKAIHQATIENSGGGDYGELDTGKLESVFFIYRMMIIIQHF